ncbi:MAG: UvrD-helicase domain-containing protein [Succinivibrio sp.]
MTAPDTNALDALTLPLGRSSMIRASAGTGKTYTITILAVRLLLGDFSGKCGPDVPFAPNPLAAARADQILIVTFTNAAAAELRSRVRARVHEARLMFSAAAAGSAASQNQGDPLQMLMEKLLSGQRDDKGRMEVAARCAAMLDQAEHELDEAAICTIHSFCDRALSKIFAFEAGEPFENDLKADISEQQDEAVAEIWRSLFYCSEGGDDKAAAALFDLLSQGGGERRLRADLVARIGDLEGVRASEESRLKSVADAGSGRPDQMFRGFRVSGKAFWEAASELKGARAPLRGKIRKVLLGLPQKLAQKQDAVRSRIRDAAEDLAGALTRYQAAAGDGESVEELFNKSARECLLSILDAGPEEIASSLGACVPLAGAVTDSGGAMNKVKARKLSEAARKRAEELLTLLSDLRDLCNGAAGESGAMREAALTLAACMVIERRGEICSRDHVLSFDSLLSSLDRAIHDKEHGDTLASTLRDKYPVAMIDESQDTDPIQYSIFSRIYLNERARTEGARVMFIGDPKQSIYSFRNADIHSYNLAGRAVRDLFDGGDQDEAERHVLTLPTNYRSCKAVVGSVNDIFGGFEGEGGGGRTYPFSKDGAAAGDEAIPFERSGARDGRTLRLDGITPGCIVTNVMAGENSRKKTCRDFTASAAADDIAACLERGAIVEADGSERPVRPSDIAVIVSSGSQNLVIARELSKRGIASVYFSEKGSVLADNSQGWRFQEGAQADPRPTEAAQNVLSLMDAMADYQVPGKVKRLLGTRMAALGADGFAGICGMGSDGEELENETALLRDCRRQWEEFGFFSAFSTWCYRHGTIGRIEGCEGGERFLTDCFQIAELVQDKRGEIPGIRAQAKWLRSQCDEGGGADDSERLRRRLESENEQVKVYTIHKSKGLEFPVVFLPFVWCSRNEGARDGEPVRYYDGGRGYRLDLDASDAAAEAKRRGDAEEACRQLYVALTRASAANFIYLSDKEASTPGKESAIAMVLSRWGRDFDCVSSKTNKPAQAAFDRMRRGAGEGNAWYDFREREVADPEDGLAPRAMAQARQVVQERGETAVQEATRGMVGRGFSVSSYTAVTRGLHDREFEDAPRSGGARAPDASMPSRFNFPRGTEAGTFLHKVLETCPFDRILRGGEPNWFWQIPSSDKARMFEQWSRQVDPEGVGPDGVLGRDLAAPFNEWFTALLDRTLLATRNGDLRLGSLKRGNWIPEMEYLIPAEGDLDTTRINDLCLESARGIEGLEVGNLVLDARTLHGYVTGSLDLVMRLPGENPRRDLYFVADYKSNYLGPDDGSYSTGAVRDSVFDPHNRYDVQYLFYTLALHRFLKSRLGDNYSYEENFGGVLYLYLRGLGPDPKFEGEGVFHTKPDIRIVEELDAMFRGEGQ